MLEEHLKRMRERNITASVAVDNQASLQRHQQRKQGPGSYIINEVQRMYRQIRRDHEGITIRFRWVPGHEGITGSKKVDEEAKRAARGAEENRGKKERILQKELPASKSATKQELERRQKKRSEREYKESPRYRRMERIEEEGMKGIGGFRKVCKKLDLDRNQVSILVQLQTEHVPLEAYLHKFKKVEHPTCQQCGNEPETVTHYLRYTTSDIARHTEDTE